MTKLFACFLLIAAIAGCKPTYTNENIEQSIIKICKDDYKIDIKTKRIANTLGVYVPINGLFESKAQIKGREAAPEDILSDIKFSKEAADRIGDVSMALSRAVLSTDAPIDFYVLVASDTKATGLQIIITRYAMDIKRLMLEDVSQGEYHQRLLMDMDFGPVNGAEETVKEFFYDLSRLSSQAIITRYFSKITNIRVESSDFFLYLSELSYKATRRFYVTEIKGAQIDKTKVLVKCKVRENYTPAAGYENFKFLYPSGFTNEYLILLDTSYIPYMIEQVLPLLKDAPLPERFKAYEKPDAWEKGGFFLEPITLPEFLARQLASRIRELYQTDSRLKNKFAINLIKGEYQPQQKKFKVMFDIEAKGIRPERADFNDVWKIISDVLRHYDFKDFASVELFNIADAKKEVMLRQELLYKFWPKWLIKR